ncbi:unnamed protein product [Rotaria socialis]|uniref:Uncharacterized protein n=1 Tax=Rotaria socialis TaxID=392032 RepID=A0A819A9Y4_9BILA|nr:unnamed protein product [Rotaria socialis]
MPYYLADQSVTSIKNNKGRFSDLNGELLLDRVNQNKQRIDEIERNVVHNKQTHTFKIHLTLTSQYGDEEKDFRTNEISKNEEFITVNKNNKRKQRRTNDYNEKQNNDDALCIIEPNLETMKKSNENYGRMLINSKNRTSNIVNNNKSYRSTYHCDHHDIKYNNKSNKMMNENEVKTSCINGNTENENMSRNTFQNNNSNDEHDDTISISDHALHYAVENPFTSLKIICQPKVNQNEANNLIKPLLAYIEKPFRELNKNMIIQ